MWAAFGWRGGWLEGGPTTCTSAASDPAGRLQRDVSSLACILDTGGPSGYTLNIRFNIEYLAIDYDKQTLYTREDNVG